MVFSSITFLFYFLPCFMLAYAVLPGANIVLLAGSLVFYAWGDLPRVPVLLTCIALNWTCGLAIAKGRKSALVFGVIGNLALLFWFKYAAFGAAQASLLANWFGLPPVPIPEITLPLGISFFTFQGISYLVDIHRGVVRAQPSLLKFAMYKSMFPPLIAGPIVRYAVVADRVDRRNVTAPALASGIETFIIGLAQKVLLANTLAVPVDRIFALPTEQLSPQLAWIGAFGYALQIYFDFAGYSNMAIGLGRMLGFELPINFNRPYASQSVSEFWRRWHITLSTWFRDYLYIPLGGNRRGNLRTYCNLLVVFLLCGLWHGAAWNFAIWGLYHGAFLTAERMGLNKVLARLPGIIRHAYLVVVVIIGWVPFRADSLGHAAMMWRAMAGATNAVAVPVDSMVSTSAWVALVAGAVLSVWKDGVILRPPQWALEGIRQGTCIVLLICSAASLAAGTYNPFIYFRF